VGNIVVGAGAVFGTPRDGVTLVRKADGKER
jgi:hypothetical protein